MSCRPLLSLALLALTACEGITLKAFTDCPSPEPEMDGGDAPPRDDAAMPLDAATLPDASLPDATSPSEPDATLPGDDASIPSPSDGGTPDASEDAGPALPKGCELAGASPLTCSQTAKCDVDCTLPECDDGVFNPLAGEACDGQANCVACEYVGGFPLVVPGRANTRLCTAGSDVYVANDATLYKFTAAGMLAWQYTFSFGESTAGVACHATHGVAVIRSGTGTDALVQRWLVDGSEAFSEPTTVIPAAVLEPEDAIWNGVAIGDDGRVLMLRAASSVGTGSLFGLDASGALVHTNHLAVGIWFGSPSSVVSLRIRSFEPIVNTPPNQSTYPSYAQLFASHPNGFELTMAKTEPGQARIARTQKPYGTEYRAVYAHDRVFAFANTDILGEGYVAGIVYDYIGGKTAVAPWLEDGSFRDVIAWHDQSVLVGTELAGDLVLTTVNAAGQRVKRLTAADVHGSELITMAALGVGDVVTLDRSGTKGRFVLSKIAYAANAVAP